MKVGLLVAVLVAATTMVSWAQETSSKQPKVLADGVGAKFKRFDNMGGVRFMEIFLACRDPKTGKLVAPCYNTMYTSKGGPTTKDTAPQALVEGLDLKKIAREHGVIKASLNGPKIWFPNWVEVAVGTERKFNRMTAGWCAQLDMSEFSIDNNVPYKPTTIKRTSKWGWIKGTRVLLLDDPDGNVWIMKGFQLGLKPKISYEKFVAAGQSNFKKLPPGWKFRVTTLKKDVIEIPDNNVATIMPDEFFNVYDLTGPGMTDYKP